MFRNYVITALRNIARNPLYAAINILGLAVGVAAAMLIALYVHDELSYDTWIPGHERVYRVDVLTTPAGHRPVVFGTTNVHLAEELRLDFLSIDAAARLAVSTTIGVRKGDIENIEPIGWADASFFTLFPVPAIAGDLRTALVSPDGLVLTRTMARKYFGTDRPLGQILELDHHAMHVTAVLEDLPSNTHLAPRIFASARAPFSRIAQLEALPPERSRGVQFCATYIRLAPGVAVGAIERRLGDFIRRRAPEGDIVSVDTRYEYHLVPLAKLHFDAATRHPGSAAMNAAMIGIAVLILIAAATNFINLTTARATRRATEVGIRKTTGARRHDVIVQLLGETFIYVAMAAALAMLLVKMLLPAFDALLRRGIAINLMHSGAASAALLLFAVGLTLVAGTYPAFILSSFRPAEVLKGGIVRMSDRGRVRRALVILQFAILIALCFATAVIYRQSVYAVHEDLRLADDQVLIIQCEAACTGDFRDRVRALPGVRDAAYTHLMPLTEGRNSQYVTAHGRRIGLRSEVIEAGALELYGFKPLAGRFFNPSRPGDAAFHTDGQPPVNPPIVINETAVHTLGYRSPADAAGQSVRWSRPDVKSGGLLLLPPATSEIIGVVPDFVMDTIRTKIDPAFFYVDDQLFNLLNVKLSGQAIPETLSAIGRLSHQLASPRPIPVRFLNQVTEDLYRDVTQQSALLAIFAGVSVLVACLGLFGLASFIAEQRTKEIGIRKAMGASRADVLRMLLWQFAKPILWANVIAWPAGGYLMHRWLQGFAYHVRLEPVVFIGASAVALVIALATVAGHTLLVARAKPVTALRYE